MGVCQQSVSSKLHICRGHPRKSITDVATVLIISFSDLKRDPRVSRHIQALASEFQIITCGLAPPRQAVMRHVQIQAQPRRGVAKLTAGASILLRDFERFYWSHPFVIAAWPQLEHESYDVILANDLLSLPIALRVAKGGAVVFDAHEYSPGENSHSWLWRTLFFRYCDYLCRTYLHRAHKCFTVCDGIAAAYQHEYGADMSVIDNAAPFHNLPVRSTNADNIRMIHHGAAIPARRLERMIEMMEYADARYTLDFMLVPDAGDYLLRLKSLARGNPRISFRRPVPTAEIVRCCSEYDIGVYLLEPINPNHKFALPNKLFEFIQARLAVVIGPSPEMAKIVRKYDCGVVAESFEPKVLAGLLNCLTCDDIDRLKQNADGAARVHHAESHAAHLRNIVRSAIDSRKSHAVCGWGQ